MANTAGGLIALGVGERDDHAFYIAGLADIDKVERNLWNTLGDRHKVSANVLNRNDVSQVEIDGLRVLIVRLPKADRAQRPVYLNGSWERHTYVRVHDGDRAVPSDVARRMLADAQPNRDAQVLPGFGRADLDDETIRRYREILAARRPEHPFLQKVNGEFLTAIGAWGRDRDRDSEGPTLGGLLMFGKEQSLRERFPHWHLSFREAHLHLSQMSLLPENSVAALRRQWGDRFVALGELARLILVTAHAEGRVTHARIRELTDQHSRDVTLKLQELVRAGFLTSADGGRGTSYSLAALDRKDVGDGSLRQSSRPRPPQRYPQSPPQTLTGLSQSPAGLSQTSPSLSQTTPRSSQSSAGEVSMPLVAKVAAGVWSPSGEIRAAIVEYCRDGFRTVTDIAKALNRRASTIRQNCVIAMAADGQLDLRYPDVRNHPDQAYRTRSAP